MSPTGSENPPPTRAAPTIPTPAHSPAQWWILWLLLGLSGIVFALAFALFRLAH